MSGTEFATIILRLSRSFAFSVTSWGRTKIHNAAVGGDVNSEHLRWMAVDCVLDDPSRTPEFKKAINAEGLGWNDEGDHIHIQRHLADLKK